MKLNDNTLSIRKRIYCLAMLFFALISFSAWGEEGARRNYAKEFKEVYGKGDAGGLLLALKYLEANVNQIPPELFGSFISKCVVQNLATSVVGFSDKYLVNCLRLSMFAQEIESRIELLTTTLHNDLMELRTSRSVDARNKTTKDIFRFVALWFEDINVTLSSKYDKDKRPFLNIVPPESVNLPPGVSANEISDDHIEARMEYKRSLHENREYARFYNEQMQGRRTKEHAIDSIRTWLKSADEPARVSALDQLTKSGMNKQDIELIFSQDPNL